MNDALTASPRDPIVDRVRRSDWLVPILAFAIALMARLHGIGDKPLWYDEVLTLKRAALPFADLIADSFHNKHYPLYFLLTKPFATADWSEAGLRLPACVFGAVSVLMAARIAGDLAGRWAAVATGALMALAPLEVQYGQEARPYTLATAGILTAVWGLTALLRASDCEPFGHARRKRVAWCAYAIGMAIALNTIGAAAPSLVAINVCVAGLAVLGRLPSDWPMRTWLLVNLGIVVLWLPGLVSLLLANSGAATRGLAWVPPMTWDLATTVLATLYMLQLSDLLTFERLTPPVPFLGLGVVVLFVAGCTMALRRSPRVGVVLIGLTLAMPISLALVSIAKPMFVPRYLLWSTGPFYVLVGAGITLLPTTLPRIAATFAILLGAVLSVRPYYAAETKPRWDLAAAYLTERAGDRDATVVSSGLARLMLHTYAARHAARPLDALLTVRTTADIEHAFQTGASVWLVHGRAGQGGALVSRRDFTAAWPALGAAVETVAIGRHIVIWRHARSAP